jgi:exonuclease III
MKLLSWNCRGLGKASAVRALRKLILTHRPDMVFLTETKLQGSDFLLRKIPWVITFLTTFLLIVL